MSDSKEITDTKGLRARVVSNPRKAPSHIPIWEYSNYVFQKLLKFSHLSLYGMYNFCLIFGHFRQFPIFNLWIRPLWFSTLQL